MYNDIQKFSPLHQKIVCGTLAATMVLSAVPTAAIAKSSSGSASSAAQSERALANYSASFSNADIALPEGVDASDDGIVLTSAAPQQLATAAKTTGWDKADKKVDYTLKGLGYVSKDAKKVGEYGKSFFDVIKGCATGNYAEAFCGGAQFLNLIGVLDGSGTTAASNAELTKDVKELKALVDGMSEELDDNTKQTYQNRLTVFDNAVGALAIETEAMEGMYAKAYKLAKERGLLDKLEAPRAQAPAEVKLPAEPAALELPAEPAEVVLPAKPAATVAAESDDAAITVIGEGQQAAAADAAADDQAIADWRAECDRLNADHDKAVADWKAECERLTAEHDKAVADWKAECDRLNAEHDKAVADYEAQKDETTIDDVLVKVMREEDQKGNRSFRDFGQFMTDIRRNFENVAIECAKKEGASPFHAFDSYWNLHFNWDTQGYFLRQAYRTTAEHTLKRAYALLATYFGFEADPDEATTAKPLTEALQAALNGIDALPAGTDPTTIDPRGEFSVKCLVTGKTAKHGGPHYFAEGNLFSDAQAEKYVARLHGRSVIDDLKLAGLYDPNMDNGSFVKCPDGSRWWPVVGIAIRSEKSPRRRTNYNEYWARVLRWNGKMETLRTGDDEGKHNGTNPAYHCLGKETYWWFDMA